ncbi:hypothetical protein [Pseudaestuariivita atlantica]|uniref:hypothetical protein n=1 Tax=Pseudaestuariivita atlantica TaxID=1317121 RepID=UPI0013F4783F|nr:hypothetical protein [Pseudaestuariivita atlantica]
MLKWIKEKLAGMDGHVCVHAGLAAAYAGALMGVDSSLSYAACAGLYAGLCMMR